MAPRPIRPHSGKARREIVRLVACAIALVGLGLGPPRTPAYKWAIDPLPSWTDDATKRMITGFVQRVTNGSGKEFVPVANRIAVFDNDGTLWCEQPMYVEVVYSFARVEKMVKTHPELRSREPYATVVDRDTQALTARGDKGLAEVVV